MEIISLETRNTSYQIGISDVGYVLHLYCGEKTACDMSYILQYYDRGFSGNPYEAGNDRTVSPDLLPLEYPCYGNGDFRSPAVNIRNKQGIFGVDLRYKSHHFVNGKYRISGLPAVYAEEKDAQTLEIVLEDKAFHIEVVLRYGILPELDVITRCAVVRNKGKEVFSTAEISGLKQKKTRSTRPGCRWGFQMILFWPLRQNTTYWADSHHPWEYVWIEFDGMYATEIVKLAGLTMTSPIYRSSDKVLAETMKDTMLELARKSGETQFYKISRLYQFADLLIRSSSSAKKWDFIGSMSDYYLQTAFSYIEHNFMYSISVESIAIQCNIHRNRLLKIFKASLGMSPQEYLITYRMSKAAQLLTTTKLSIKEIGNAVGYPNQLHFSRAFKSIYGIPPRQYREEKKKIDL